MHHRVSMALSSNFRAKPAHPGRGATEATAISASVECIGTALQISPSTARADSAARLSAWRVSADLYGQLSFNPPNETRTRLIKLGTPLERATYSPNLQLSCNATKQPLNHILPNHSSPNMSAAIATSSIAAGRVFQRAVVRCSRPQFLRLRAQRPAARSFTMSSRGWSPTTLIPP